MILFSKDKEIIFKITNAVLLIWLVGAMVFTCASVINLLVKEPNQEYTYDEYEIMNCTYYKNDATLSEAQRDSQCLVEYNNYKLSNKNIDYYKWISLYSSIANIVIVGGVLFFINKKKK